MPVRFPARGARRLGLAAVVALAAAPARSELPPGWTVQIFAGRIHEIEPAGGVLAGATDGGLLFFDPRTGTFAPPVADAGCTNGECLSSNRLTCVSRDAAGGYWVGTEASGAVVFRPTASQRRYGRFFTVNTTPGGGLLADSVTCIEAWRSETVYVGTSRGVAQIDLAGGVDSYNEEASRRLGTDLRGAIVHDIAVDSLYVWVATDSGVSRYDRRPPYAVQFLPDSLAGRDTYTIEILGGTVHAGTAIGAFRWRESARYWERIRNCPTCVPQLPPNFRVNALARLPDGRLFAASEGSVYFFNGFVWGQLAPPGNYLLGDRRFTTIVASGDTVWTCQHNDDGEGAYLDSWSVAQPSWRRFAPNAIPPSEIQVMSLGPGGEVWIGTRLAGVARLAPDGTWCIWNGDDPAVRSAMSDPEGHVSALLAARNGRAWFTALPQPELSAPVDMLTASSGCDHTADTWSHILPGQLGFAGRYWRAEEDAEGNVFLCADGEAGDPLQEPHGGMDVVAAGGTQKANLRADVLGGSSVGAFAFETTTAPWNRAYLGLNGLLDRGLVQWVRSGQLFPPAPPPTSANFHYLLLPDSLDVAEYRDIVVTPGNPRRIWVATSLDVFEYDVDSQCIMTTLAARRDASPGLLSGDIKDLQFDDFGNLWVASIKGLNRVRLAEREPPCCPSSSCKTPLPSIDAFTTIETIRELNAASSVGQLYDPRRALAPLPAPLVNALRYDSGRDVLYIATEAGLASLDVEALSRGQVIPLESAVLYPNPVRIDAGQQEVRIANISEPATVTIFNLEGEIVCEVTDREDGDVVWSLGTPSCLDAEGNFRIASGVYPVRITTSAGSTMRTVVVLR